MPNLGTAPLRPFLAKMNRLDSLDPGAVDAIRAMPIDLARYPARHVFSQEGAAVSRCCIIVDGYAARFKISKSGERQIVAFHMAGDLIDIQPLFIGKSDHSAAAISNVRVAWLSAGQLAALMDEHRSINCALWRDTLINASIHREWVLNIGCRSAKARVAHMLCEFSILQKTAGLGELGAFSLPMSQTNIADATGLTTVHVNRMLQSLDIDGLIKRDRRSIVVLDDKALRNLAGFNEQYLHLAKPEGHIVYKDVSPHWMQEAPDGEQRGMAAEAARSLEAQTSVHA